MKNIFTYFSLLLSISISAQDYLFNDKIDNSSKILFHFIGHEKLLNDSTDTLQSFYISGSDDIEGLVKKIKIYKSNEELFCGFDYLICQTNQHKVQLECALNIECNYALINDQPYKIEIDSSIFFKKQGYVYGDYINYKNLKKARRKLPSIQNDTGVFIFRINKNEWINYQGEFFIHSDKNIEEFTKYLETFHKEFKLEHLISNNNSHLYTIYSNYSLYNKIDIGKKLEWRAYNGASIFLLSTQKEEIDKYIK